jgi:hypothetical protein
VPPPPSWTSCVLPVRVEIEREEDGRVLASVPELPGVMAYGGTEHEAVPKFGAPSPLRKLGGMMMFSNIFGPSTGMSNIVFCPASFALKPISAKIASVLGWGQLA